MTQESKKGKPTPNHEEKSWEPYKAREERIEKEVVMAERCKH